MIGRIAGNYWEVPAIEGIEGAPRSDQLKHFGAAMASFGSIAMFHIVGLTPEAEELGDVAQVGLPSHRVTRADVHALQRSYRNDDRVDVVVFSAPQLSLYELRDLADICEGLRFKVPLLAVTSPQIKPDSDRMGYTARIEDAGGTVLSGMCFYQSYAREIAEARRAVGVRKRHHDHVAAPDRAHVDAYGLNHTDRLVAHRAAWRCGLQLVVGPKVASTDAGAGYADNRISRMHNRGIGDVFDPNIAGAVHDSRTHGSSFPL